MVIIKFIFHYLIKDFLLIINKDNIPCYVLYVTNHPLSFLTLEIVESRLEYHARVKTQVTSRLEKLK